MNDEIILKAAECCFKNGRCDGCPLSEDNPEGTGCMANLRKISYDFMVRQYENNKQGFTDYCNMRDRAVYWMSRCKELEKRLETLEDDVTTKMMYMCGCHNCIETVSRIIKGNREPFKNYCDNCGLCEEREKDAVEEYIKNNRIYIPRRINRRRCFCIDCGTVVDAYVKSNNKTVNIRGVEFTYEEKSVYCTKCNTEVYDGEINDVNVDKREQAYEAAIKNGLQK